MNIMIDSGAYSISMLARKSGSKVDIFGEYREYLENYIFFVKTCQMLLGEQNKDKIVFVTLDVIRDIAQTRKVYEYMVRKGCNVMPVVHFGASPSALQWYLDCGCEYVGLGGLSHKVLPSTYMHHADTLFDLLVDARTGKAMVKVHGFAITAKSLLLRYPWWSVDSTSLWKHAAYGLGVYVPTRKVNGEFDFLNPLIVKFSERQASAKFYVKKLNRSAMKILVDYLELVGFVKKFYDEGLTENDIYTLNAVFTLMMQNSVGNACVSFVPKVGKVFVL